ncbi:MAG: glycosyltransferase family 61 protein [Alphaproteobacteria bacterium]|nr:glycosyltransferase family 61 protein [Alphaproteobacteria bacterium]
MSCTIFGEPNFVRYFKKHVSKQYMIETSVVSVDRGIIVNEHDHGFGVFDDKFNLIPESLQIRKNNGQYIPKFNHNNIPYIDEYVVFIGNVYPHFGHFLLEHMNRLYALLDKAYKDMRVVLINNMNVSPVPKYIYDFIELFGVKHDNIIILDKTTQFKHVYVPVQSFNMDVYSSKSFGKTFDRIAENTPSVKGYDKIYVSRAALDNRHKVFGEERVQSVFEKNGFKIIYPETLPLKKQISLVRGASVLAGCAGTALHLGLFMKPGGMVIQIKRNRMPKCNASIQDLLNRTKGLDSVFISGSIEKHKMEHGSKAPQIIGVNKYMREFFDAYNFKYDKNDIAPDKKAWAEYNELMREYIKTHDSAFVKKLKKCFIHWSALIVPTRYLRGRWRKFLKRKLNYEK